MKAQNAGLKQFRREGRLSYILSDRESRKAAVIDPCLELMDDYRSYLAEGGLVPELVIDTRAQAEDPDPAACLVNAEFGARIGSSDLSNGGRRQTLGTLELRILEWPAPRSGDASGRVSRSCCVLLSGMIFTGRALGSDASGASDWGESWIGDIPDGTLVFPGFDTNDLIFSTIEVERGGNPGWSSSDPVATINSEKYAHKLKASATEARFVDVREPEEFREGHIPGTMNIPLSELGFHLEDLRSSSRIYVCCLSGRRSVTAARTLTYIGLSNVISLSGGFKAWQSLGFPVQKLP